MLLLFVFLGNSGAFENFAEATSFANMVHFRHRKSPLQANVL